LIPDLSERALVLAPHGRDAEVAAAILAEAGVPGAICASVDELVGEMEAGAGFGLVTEEALRSADLKPLSAWISSQPDWSDFPFILLTARGGGLERNPAAGRLLGTLGNVTFLERPFHPTTLVSLAQAAIRGRKRQYEARIRLAELHTLAADLERRVEERTAERESALGRLHEAQKLETLGQLTGGVAHDFNNLLTPIIGALELLKRKFAGQDPRTDAWIVGALQSGERAKTLVQRLLGFARRQQLSTGAVDISGLLRGMRDLVASSIGPTVELQLRCATDLPKALADPHQLELVVLNLCVNARDAMPDGGPLTIAAESALIGPDNASGLSPGLYVRLSVIDAGSGMDPQTLARAVEPFFSTKGTGRGTGLGLSMVHGFAAQLGGAFELSSARGKGTRADLYLPVAADAAATAPGGRKAVGPAVQPSGPFSILLVDDEELVREATAEMLRGLGHAVVEAGNGTDALGKLEADSSIELVVTDYKMPRMDGAELARRVRLTRPEMPILIITGYAGDENAGFDLPRVDKPFGVAELAAAVARVMAPGTNVVAINGRRGRPPA
jgi:signal transduction histidine kinase